MSSMSSRGDRPSTVQPTEWQVPKISLTVPLRYLDIDLGLIDRAMATISSNDKFPLCLIFFCLLRSLGGSFNALMTKDAADGTTVIVACLFWIVNWTVIFKPFQSLVALAISSPTFFGDYKRRFLHKHPVVACFNRTFIVMQFYEKGNRKKGRFGH